MSLGWPGSAALSGSAVVRAADGRSPGPVWSPREGDAVLCLEWERGRRRRLEEGGDCLRSEAGAQTGSASGRRDARSRLRLWLAVRGPRGAWEARALRRGGPESRLLGGVRRWVLWDGASGRAVPVGRGQRCPSPVDGMDEPLPPALLDWATATGPVSSSATPKVSQVFESALPALPCRVVAQVLSLFIEFFFYRFSRRID